MIRGDFCRQANSASQRLFPGCKTADMSITRGLGACAPSGVRGSAPRGENYNFGALKRKDFS